MLLTTFDEFDLFVGQFIKDTNLRKLGHLVILMRMHVILVRGSSPDAEPPG